MQLKTYLIHVIGTVQGVGFRFFTQQQAQQLSLTGYVTNLSHGDVEILIQGCEAKCQQLLQWLAAGGPTSATITHYDYQIMPNAPTYSNFNIKYKTNY